MSVGIFLGSVFSGHQTAIILKPLATDMPTVTIVTTSPSPITKVEKKTETRVSNSPIAKSISSVATLPFPSTEIPTSDPASQIVYTAAPPSVPTLSQTPNLQAVYVPQYIYITPQLTPQTQLNTPISTSIPTPTPISTPTQTPTPIPVSTPESLVVTDWSPLPSDVYADHDFLPFHRIRIRSNHLTTAHLYYSDTWNDGYPSNIQNFVDNNWSTEHFFYSSQFPTNKKLYFGIEITDQNNQAAYFPLGSAWDWGRYIYIKSN